MLKLLEMVFGRKRIERITERIGAERLRHAEQELATFEKLTLMEKIEGPAGVVSPTAAAVMVDGGRYQQTQSNPQATSQNSTHWFEYKAGICLELEGRRDKIAADPQAPDPCPEVPEFLLNLDYMEKLTREIGQKAAAVEGGESASVTAEVTAGSEPAAPREINLDQVKNLADLEAQIAAALTEDDSSKRRAEQLPLSPQVKRRDVVATTQKGHRIGLQLAARAWTLGLFQAPFKAFVGDGSGWIWTIYEQHFKPFGFQPILDIIHAVTYVYAGALAGRTRVEGAPVYRQWVQWLWEGNVSELIVALAARQAELGLPAPGESETSPRAIVSKALTYLQNHQSQMRYPDYRRRGLPITSSHMESTIKELNYRIKGTEKFWSEDGGTEVLQLKADTLCASDPLSQFWKERQHTRTGFRNNVGPKKCANPSAAA